MSHLNKCYKFQNITKDNVNQIKHNSRLFIVPSACLSITFKQQDQERVLLTVFPLPIFMDNWLTFSRTFLAFSIQWIRSPSINEGVGSHWDSSCCFCVFCESRELGGRMSSRFPCVTPVIKTFSQDRVAVKTLSNNSNGVPILCLKH